MDVQNDRPSDNELLAIAVEKAKADGFTSTQIKTEDDAAQTVLHHLPARFHTLPLGTIRRMILNLSRAGLEPGIRKRDPIKRGMSSLAAFVKAYPRADEHSQTYEEIHSSDEYLNLVDTLKRRYDYACQLCRRESGERCNLEGHITDYVNWNKPGRILILCREFCHPVADALLRSAKTLQPDVDLNDLFTIQENEGEVQVECVG